MARITSVSSKVNGRESNVSVSLGYVDEEKQVACLAKIPVVNTRRGRPGIADSNSFLPCGSLPGLHIRLKHSK
jgi:hypothetical protein